MIQRPFITAAFTSCLLAAGMLCCDAAQAQMVQTPYVSVYAGIPATTFNGTTLSGTICSASLDTFGDGCPATQATLDIPRGLVTDLLGNAFITEPTAHQLRVVYQGGAALAAALIAGAPGYSFTPTPGYIYALGQGTTGNPILFSGAGVFCSGTSGPKTLDTSGDGCPAQYFASHPGSAIAIDPNDNIFFGDSGYPSSGSSVHIFYVGGTAAANLIKAYNPSVTTPQPGYVYALSVTGGTNSGTATSDFNAVSTIAVDTNDNIYVGDTGGVVTTTTGILASSIGGQIKKFVSSPVAGWTTFITNVGNVAKLQNGDGGPATSATIGAATMLGFDLNNNLYIGDQTNDSYRVVYLTAGSPTPPLYLQTPTLTPVTITPVTTPVVGDIYTVVGIPGSSARHTGQLASAWVNVYPNELGFDNSGNLILMIDQQIVSVSQSTGIVTSLAGQVSNNNGVAAATPAAGQTCNAGTTGPVMTNAYGDGCPGTQVFTIEPLCCKITQDAQGSFYIGDYRASSGTIGSVIQKYSYGGQYGKVADGTSSTQAIAFVPSLSNTNSSPVIYATPPTIALGSGGGSTTEFTDTGTNDLCDTVNGFQTCIYNVTFTPAKTGVRLGALTLTSSTATTLNTSVLGGVGAGAQLSVDPGLASTNGTGLTPGGAALDQAGNYYISSGTTTGVLYKSTAGGFPASFATGFSTPLQVAASAATGTVYVADSGNNRIAAVTSAGGVSSFLTSFTPLNSTASTTLSKPSGVAVDVAGNIYISDTGNNRIVEVQPSGVTSVLGFSGLSSPLQLAVDAARDVFVADSGNKRVVELTAAGVQTTVTVTPALVTPVGVAVDPAGDIYIADAGNQNVVLLLPGSSTATTVLSGLTGLNGVLVDNTGDVFASATGSGGLVEANRTNTAYAFTTATPTGYTATTSFTLTDAGNAPLTIGASLATNSDTADWVIASGTTNGCTINSSVAVGAQCTLSASFKPATNAGTIHDTVTFPSYNAVDAASVMLTGNTVFAQATTTTITAAANPIAYGSGTTLTITVVPTAGTLPATGQLTLTANGVAVTGSPFTLSPASSGLSATVTLTVPIMVAGSYSYVATYQGAYGLSPSTSANYVLVVSPAPSSMTTITASANPVAYGSNSTLTIQVAPASGSGVPQGQLTLTQNGVAVAGSPFTLSASGSVTFTASGLLPGVGVPGTYAFVASYVGTYSFAPSTGTLTVVVNPPAPDFILTLASGNGTINYHNSIVNTVTITPIQYSGYNLATALTCTGVPSTGECTVVPSSVTPNGTAAVSAVVTLSTGSLVSSLRSGRSNVMLAIGLFGVAGLFGLGRRRRWPRLLLALFCFGVLAAANGCSGGSASNYVLTITGTGSNGATHSLTWTVQVTQ